MKKLFGVALATGLTVVAMSSPAAAREGCGYGGHRGDYGHCRPNAGPRGNVWVADRYYAGHGYWDGSRWWQHRRQWHGHWRYY